MPTWRPVKEAVRASSFLAVAFVTAPDCLFFVKRYGGASADVGAPFLGGGGVGQHLKSHHGGRDARDSSAKGVDEKMPAGGGGGGSGSGSGSHRNANKGSTLAAFGKDVGAKVRDLLRIWSKAARSLPSTRVAKSTSDRVVPRRSPVHFLDLVGGASCWR